MTQRVERYNSYSKFLQKRFGERIHKISLDAGFTCPNIDGTRARGGCIYCDNNAFAPGTRQRAKPIAEQIEAGIGYLKTRFPKATSFLAYFQPFSNTHAPVERLKAVYDEALAHPGIVGLSVGTRPDVVADGAIDLLADYAKQGRYIQLELGLQSANEETLQRINRTHTVQEFEETVRRVKSRPGIDLCVHIILGLPGETPDMMRHTADFLAKLPNNGIKLHVLHVVKGTPLEKELAEGRMQLLSLEEYANLACDFLERTPPEVTIQRLTADAPPELHLGPDWALLKNQVLETIRNRLEQRDTYQGKLLGALPPWEVLSKNK